MDVCLLIMSELSSTEKTGGPTYSLDDAGGKALRAMFVEDSDEARSVGVGLKGGVDEQVKCREPSARGQQSERDGAAVERHSQHLPAYTLLLIRKRSRLPSDVESHLLL